MRHVVLPGAVCATLLFTTTSAAAQTAPERPAAASPADPTLPDDIVVTANRSAQARTRVGQSVTVLTREDLAANQTVAVADLLTRTPGVSLSRNGGIGTTTALRVRGAESDQTVVVIDGVKLNDPSTTGGGFNFGNLLVGDVGRIEVLRGAQSTLWGGQAIGGVVNIVTALPSAPFEATLNAEAGSRGTGYVRAGVGGVSDRVTWRLAASRFETDGFSAFARGTEADGYENTGLSGRATIKLVDGVSIDLRAIYSDGTVGIDGSPAPSFAFGDTPERARTRELVAYAGANFDLLDGRLSNRVAYGYTRTERRNRDRDQAVTPVTFDARGVNDRFEYQGVLTIADGWTATFGAEREESRFRSASPTAAAPNPVPARAEVAINGVYAQLQAEVLSGLTLTGGVRRDDHETFGGGTLGQAAAAWSLNGGATVLRASFGQGFKAPSLFQLYSDFGNGALRPEEADSWDAGIEQRLFDGRLKLAATYFGRDTTNQIDFVSCARTVAEASEPRCFRGGARRSGYYENTARTDAEGLELAAGLDAGGFAVQANYTLTDARNRTPGANVGRELARRPRETANVTASYAWPFGLTTSVAVQHAGRSFDNASNATRLEGYTLVDLRLSYSLNERIELYGRVENVGDEVYETVRNYGVARRGGFVGVRARL